MEVLEGRRLAAPDEDHRGVGWAGPDAALRRVGLVEDAVAVGPRLEKGVHLGTGRELHVGHDALCGPVGWQAVGEVPGVIVDEDGEARSLVPFVKPVLEGSSIGTAPVHTASELYPAWHAAREFGAVFAERFVDGGEYTAGFIGDQVLPLIKLETPNGFYDYEAKYLAQSL